MQAPEIRWFHTVSKWRLLQILWLLASPVAVHGMGEPNHHSINSPLGGCSGFQSHLMVFCQPLCRISTASKLSAITLSHWLFSLIWVFGLPIKPDGFYANPIPGSPKHPSL
jgi:hypothetical protein